MSMNVQALSGGFSAPVFDSQAVFRSLMDGMARPGTVQSIPTEIGQPSPLGKAAGAVALALCDADTPVWLQPCFAKTSVADWIGFHTGALLAQEKSEARFVFLQAASGLYSFDLFASGTQEYPDRSATIVIEVSSIGKGSEFVLSGPGIAERRTVSVEGLPDVFGEIWKGNRSIFPRGVDVILTAGDRLLCLPRTTRIG
nr:phosphonate C-P lyase system protein PhnH [Rhizobium sp. TCK]